MIVRLDTRQLPPTLELLEPDDLGSFKAVFVMETHTWVPPSTLSELHPEADDAWREELEGMIAFAAQRGWTDDAGRVRAHVEVVEADVGPEA